MRPTSSTARWWPSLQVSEEREEDVRLLFKKADKNPKILIVTDKLLTGYDAPLLYCLYLDKPMRDHVLLQAVARVNRPYVDKEGIQKAGRSRGRFCRRSARTQEGAEVRFR